MKAYLFLLVIVSTSCFSSPKVLHFGALRDIMHKGDISAKVNLSIIKDKKSVYALGAVGNLKGEIQILDSVSHISYVDTGKKLSFKNSLESDATLLVYAQVEKWKDYQIPKEVKTREEFEVFLEKQAKLHGLNTDKAFPFLLEGVFEINDWHVINWDSNDKEHSHKKHKQSGLNKISKNQRAKMIGFYSRNHVGVFTHHTTNMHIHFVAKDKKTAGHSDYFVLGGYVTLKLPH